jgi:UDP-N-acetylmuramate--alanine ligase
VKAPPRDPLKLAERALARPGSPFRALPERLLVVDVPGQRLTLLDHGRAVAEFPVSTAAAGVGGKAGSMRTPPGWHRIHARIGGDQPLGMVFESRVPTGQVWKGERREDDLILTRVLQLDGLEPGVNRGPGCDSLERYIYIHGTNHETELGEPGSHGCVRISNADVAWLYDQIAEGDAVLIVGEPGPSDFPDPLATGRFHYVGVAGSGMSALAQYQVMGGGRASGSDRAFDHGERPEQRSALERLGIEIHPQDGSAVGADCVAVVLSTAVESEVPDYVAARAIHLPTVHRSELLAHFVQARRTAAIAGTSGKSTVAAMTFEVLKAAHRNPSLITGGELLSLQREGLIGNAFNDPASELLVAEADESDGSLVHYRPAIGVILNLQRDHKEIAEVLVLFERFRSQAIEGVVIGEAENLTDLAPGAREIFGFGPRATVRGELLEIGPHGSRFTVGAVGFELPWPGRHNVENALAAIATCRALGVTLEEMVAPLATFGGVARRFQTVGRARGIEVIDDFAHNPAKIGAAIAAAHARARRVLAVYQPHGYGPTRFLRSELVEVFAEALEEDDRLWLLEIFYAGGTANRDLSSRDLAAEIAERGRRADFTTRDQVAARVAEVAREGDLVLVMGARDPSLTDLARGILSGLGDEARNLIPRR